jgi:hypothetical protein
MSLRAQRSNLPCQGRRLLRCARNDMVGFILLAALRKKGSRRLAFERIIQEKAGADEWGAAPVIHG